MVAIDQQVPVHGTVEIPDRHRAIDDTEPSGWARTPATVMSCSSEISPTISEDILERYQPRPRHFVTRAKCVLRRRNAQGCSDNGAARARTTAAA